MLPRVAAIVLAVIATAGCDGITSSPSRDGPAGSYSAIILFSTSTADPAVFTLESGTFTINLAQDGTTSGHLHLLPFNGTPEVDADMAGRWTRTGDNIQFDQPADTFVRNMTFTIEQFTDGAYYLDGDDVFGGTRINVTLARAPTY